MKAARLYSFTDIRIEDVPIPDLGPRDALVKTKACGICSGDVMPWYIEKKAPLVIGHEPAGEIVALGSDIQKGRFKVGDRVFIHHHAPCMECRCCERGDHVQCDTWRSTKISPGGVSEYILVPEINLLNDTFVLPDGVSFEDASLIEPTACVVKSLKRSRIKKGDTVLVIGLGVMGQLHVLLAKEFGAGKVIGADMVSFRIKKALEFGADHAIDVSKTGLEEELSRLTDGRMADVVIVGPNSVNAMKQGIESAAIGGTVTLFTPAKPDEILSFDPNDFYFKDITLTASYSCGPDDTKEALGFIERKIVSAEKLVTHRFKIEETAEAYRLTVEARGSLKCLVVFE
ncbi:MAG: alcohol dehydrogenase catalytic domain-containing protein [Nitrospirae bacterium]|nr:alcohol dehydrogenase catalytic domain-containing protein [Nitrospirota bacterium]